MLIDDEQKTAQPFVPENESSSILGTTTQNDGTALSSFQLNKKIEF